MGYCTDVAIAVTLELDKLIRQTVNMSAQGAEIIALLDGMYKGEQDGWKLYHNRYAYWYVDDQEDTPVAVLHALLTDIADDEATQGNITYMQMHYDNAVVDGLVDHCGEYNDPFNIGYTLKIDYKLQPPQPKETT